MQLRFKQLRFARQGTGQKGFTLVELMIATVVFSTILLVITFGVLHFTHGYYSGVNSSTTQNVARGIASTISQAVQFSGTPPLQSPTGLNGYVCAGSTEFAYSLGKEVDSAGSVKGLVQYAITPGQCPAPSGNGTELLQPFMRLGAFSVQNTSGNLWQITVKIVYGDNDLLCAPAKKPGSCAPGGSLSAGDFNNTTVLQDLTCRSGSGSQFCNTVSSTTTVGMRVNAGN